MAVKYDINEMLKEIMIDENFNQIEKTEVTQVEINKKIFEKIFSEGNRAI